jgi:response regulator of citrate/malate metabolism
MKNPYTKLLDIHLPGKDGIELLKYHAHRKLGRLMMVTSRADEYYSRLFTIGGDYFWQYQ